VEFPPHCNSVFVGLGSDIPCTANGMFVLLRLNPQNFMSSNSLPYYSEIGMANGETLWGRSRLLHLFHSWW